MKNMQCSFFTFICIFLFSINGHTQQQNYFSFELAGSGGFGSLNYEHTVLDRSKLDLNMRYGFSMTPVDKNNGVVLIFPVMLHCLIGENAHKLDLAAGQAISITTKGSLFLSAPLAIGYRFQPLEKKYFFRCSYTPLLSYLVDVQLQNWAGITFGYHFNRNK
jgi:hypothetical protein